MAEKKIPLQLIRLRLQRLQHGERANCGARRDELVAVENEVMVTSAGPLVARSGIRGNQYELYKRRN